MIALAKRCPDYRGLGSDMTWRQERVSKDAPADAGTGRAEGGSGGQKSCWDMLNQESLAVKTATLACGMGHGGGEGGGGVILREDENVKGTKAVTLADSEDWGGALGNPGAGARERARQACFEAESGD